MYTVFVAFFAARVEYYYHKDGMDFGEDSACQPKLHRCSSGLLPTCVSKFVDRYAGSVAHEIFVQHLCKGEATYITTRQKAACQPDGVWNAKVTSFS